MRTFHLLKTPDILCANDNRQSVNYYLGNNSEGATHFWKDRYIHVLVLYLERPATQQCAGACSWAGRFGYSDLKEAALMEGYVL